MMIEIDKFKSECEKRISNWNDILIVGKGSSKDKNGRYRQSILRSNVKETHIYAVQFCKGIRTFVAWNLKIEPFREKYTIKGEPLLDIDENRLYKIGKYVQYSGWGNEDVIAFKESAIDLFLTKYILK